MISLPKEVESRWKKCADHSAVKLLRMAVLRDYARQLHAERSTCMAKGNIPRGHAIEDVEKKLEALRDRPELLAGDETLRELLLLRFQDTEAPNTLPSSFAIPKDRLERYDRHWERAIALLAADDDWNVFAITATVQLKKVETFHERLSDQVWPDAVILFVEGLAESSTIPKEWAGKWVGVARPGFAVSLERISKTAGCSKGVMPSFRQSPDPLW
jgi:hypothetical protein